MLSLDSLTNTAVLNDVIGSFDARIRALRPRKHSRGSGTQQEQYQPPPLKKQNFSMAELLSTKELRREIKRREKKYVAAKARASTLMGKHLSSSAMSSEVEAMAKKLKCPYPFDIPPDFSRHNHLPANYGEMWYRKMFYRRKEYLCLCRREELYKDIFGDSSSSGNSKENMTESDRKMKQEQLNTWAKATISAAILSHKVHELRDARREVARGLANLCQEAYFKRESKKVLLAARLAVAGSSRSPSLIGAVNSGIDNLAGSGSGGSGTGGGTNKMDKVKQLNTIVHTIISMSSSAQKLPSEVPEGGDVPEIPELISDNISEWHLSGLRTLAITFFTEKPKDVVEVSSEASEASETSETSENPVVEAPTPQKCWIADPVELKPRALVALFLRYLALTGTSWGTHLIVCEMGTMQSWKTVLAEYAPELFVMPYWGTARQRGFCRALWDAKTPRSADSPVHVLLMPFQVLSQDKESFSSPVFSVCVIDDSYSFLSRGVPRRCGGLLLNSHDNSHGSNAGNNGSVCSIVNNNGNSNWNNNINGVPGAVLLERWDVLDDLVRKVDILLGDESYVVDNPVGAIGCLNFFGCVHRGSLHGRAATWFTKERESPFPSSVRLKSEDAATVLSLLGPAEIKRKSADFPQTVPAVSTESRDIGCALKPLQASAYEMAKKLVEDSTHTSAFKVALLHSLMSANLKLILAQYKAIKCQQEHHHQHSQQQSQKTNGPTANNANNASNDNVVKSEPESGVIGVTSLDSTATTSTTNTLISEKKVSTKKNERRVVDEWSPFWVELNDLIQKAAKEPQSEDSLTSPDDPGKLEALSRLLVHDLGVGKPDGARPIICVAGADGALSVEGMLEKLEIGYVSADTSSPIACRDATDKFLHGGKEYFAFVLQVPDAEYLWNGNGKRIRSGKNGGGEERKDEEEEERKEEEEKKRKKGREEEVEEEDEEKREAMWAWRNDVEKGVSENVILYDACWISQSTVNQVVSLGKGLRKQKRPVKIYRIFTENTCECDFK